MNIEMSTYEIKITWTQEIVFFLRFWFCYSENYLLSVVNSFMTKIPTIERTFHWYGPLSWTQWASVGIIEWTSIWYLSVDWKYGTSRGRPNSVRYGRPLDTLIGRPTDVHLRPIQQRYVCKFKSWTISSFIYIEVLRTKNCKYFSLNLKMCLLKRY